MKYDRRSVTDDGANLLAHSKAAGKRTVFGTLAITDNQPSQDVDTLTIDDLGNFLEFPISYIKKPADKTWQPSAIVGNTSINAGDHGNAFLTNVSNGAGTLNNPLSVNTVGIIAHTDGENNNVLFAAAYANPGEAITVPSATDIPYKLTLDFAVKIDNNISNDDITIQVNNAGMVNFVDLQDVLQNYIRINGDGTVTQSPDFQNSVKRRGIELVDENQLNDAVKDLAKNQKNLKWNGYISDLNQIKDDGYYGLAGVNNTEIPGFDTYGLVLKISDDTDSFYEAWDNNSCHAYKINAQPWQTYANSNDLNSMKDSINNVRAFVDSKVIGRDEFNNLKTSSFIFRGVHSGSIRDVFNDLDGYYQIANNTQDGPADFDGYGNLLKYDAGGDLFLVLKDNFNNEWHNHYGNQKWDGWQRVATQKDLDTINGQLGGFKYQGVLNCDFFDVDKNNKPDGYYQINGKSDNIDGFSGYGILNIKRQGFSTYLTVASLEGVWRTAFDNGKWNNWQRFAMTDEVQKLLNQKSLKWNGYISDLNQIKDDGYYGLAGVNNTEIPGFDTYGLVLKISDDTDSFYEAWDNNSCHAYKIKAQPWQTYATTKDTSDAYQNAVNTANSYTNNQLSSANNQVTLNSVQASVQAIGAVTSANSYTDSQYNNAVNYTNSHGSDIYNWALNDAKKYTDNRIGLMDDPYINHNCIPLPVGTSPATSPNNFLSVGVTAHYNVSTHQIMLNGLINYQNLNNVSTTGDIFFIDANCLKFNSVTSDDFKDAAFSVRNQGGWITLSMGNGDSLSGQNGYLNVNNWLIGVHQ